jgi:two-component system, LytTR family, sensor kinase
VKIGRLWLVIAAACTVPAVLDGALSYVQGALSGRPPGWQEVFWQVNEWLILGALTPLVYWLARRYPLRPPIIGRNLLAHAGGALLLCIGWATAGASLRWVLGIGPTQTTKAQQLTGWLLTTIPWGTFMYFTMLGCFYAFGYFVEAKEREAQTARLAAQVAEARLGALRAQLHPHFLFNSLNAITVLVRDQDTTAAARMLDLLSDVLRQVLRSDKAHEVSLDTELRFLERYLAIEQVRFSDRLRVRFDVEDDLLEATVPEFLLQPIVENALRHGIAKRAEGGLVEIVARRDGNSLVLSVSDDGPDPDTPRARADEPGAEPGNGLGLANARERLTTLYGAGGRLELKVRSAADGGGTLAVVTLPLRFVSVATPQSPSST